MCKVVGYWRVGIKLNYELMRSNYFDIGCFGMGCFGMGCEVAHHCFLLPLRHFQRTYLFYEAFFGQSRK